MPEIILYQFGADVGVESGSPFCVKVHRVLAYKGLEYATRAVGSPGELKRINARARKVPVLSYDGTLVTDSSRILDFIEQRHPAPALWPEDGPALALSRLLEDWADESLYWFAVYNRWAVDENFHPFARRTFGKLPPPLRWIVPGVVRRGVRKQLEGQGIGRLTAAEVDANLERHLALIEGLLADHAFLTGDALTAGDIAVFAPLRALSVSSMAGSPAIVRRHASVVEWIRRVDQATQNARTVAFE